MTPTAPEVKLPSRGIWLPEDLYLKMAACFFGSGPRHADPILPPPVEGPSGPQERISDMNPAAMRATPHVRLAVPRGAAARLFDPHKMPTPATSAPPGAGGTFHAG